jgi:hypothetical protein
MMIVTVSGRNPARYRTIMTHAAGPRGWALARAGAA